MLLLFYATWLDQLVCNLGSGPYLAVVHVYIRYELEFLMAHYTEALKFCGCVMLHIDMKFIWNLALLAARE